MNGVKISQLLPPPDKVPTGVGEFEVNGLTLPEVTALIQRYRTEFARLLVMGPDNEPNYSEIIDLAPEMVVEVIAMAARVDQKDAEEIEAIRRLPAGVHLIALSKIWQLTVVDSKNFQALLQSITSGLRGVASAKLQSSPGKTSVASLQRSEPS